MQVPVIDKIINVTVMESFNYIFDVVDPISDVMHMEFGVILIYHKFAQQLVMKK